MNFKIYAGIHSYMISECDENDSILKNKNG